MRRALAVCLGLVGACGSSKGEPPPDPHGGCAKARAAFDKVEHALGVVAASASAPTDVFCGQLHAAVKAAQGIQFAAFAASLRDDGVKAKAAGAVKTALGELLDKASAIASRCPEQGVEGTQAALVAQLGKSRTLVDTACAK